MLGQRCKICRANSPRQTPSSSIDKIWSRLMISTQRSSRLEFVMAASWSIFIKVIPNYYNKCVSFKDHFSGLASAYARYRPTYPPELAAHLAAIAPSRALALDLATGNGQAAIDLAMHFDRVLASDASARQLAEAVAHPRVFY